MKKKLDYDKPIMAISTTGTKFLLVPVLKEKGFGLLGWDWLNIDTMEHNSCVHWDTKEKAVEAYSHREIYNARITRRDK